MQLKVCENEDGIIKVSGTKEFKPVTRQASKWVREDQGDHKKIEYPNTTNGVSIKQTSLNKISENAIGCFMSDSNTIYKNAQAVSLFTMSITSHFGSLSITKENLMKVCALFTARKTINNTWINHYDEYSAPNTDHPDYQQWNNDACIYALFNSKSNQSSLRNVQYKGKTYQIKNEFFFMAKDEMKDLADKTGYADLYHDAKFEQSDRYVYTLLSTITLSEDAKNLLELAKELTRETMPKREAYSREHPELNLNSWDAGYVQLKGLWKEAAPEKFKLFREDYLKFEKRMRAGVYKFGFLEPDFSTVGETL